MSAIATRPKLGFLGAGWIGKHRLDAIVADGAAVVAAVADPAVEGALDSFEELLEHDLDGVVIATPSALHAEQALAALEQGLAVFCQKPLARTAEETARVVGAARTADRLLGVDFSYRHLAGVRAMKERLPDDVHAVDLVFHNAYGPDKPWFYDRALSGGGCVIDVGIHLVDLALWLLDWPRVAGVSSRLHARADVEDYAVAQLELDGDVVVRLACSWHAPIGRDAEIEARFLGTESGVQLRNVDGSFYDFVAEHVRGRDVETLAVPPDEWGGRAAVAWAQQLATSRAFDPDVEHALDVARVVDAIYGRSS